MRCLTKDTVLNILIYQGSAVAANKAANLAQVQRISHSASLLGADAVVFPELFTTGYNLGAQLHDLAEPLQGDSFHQLADMACRYQLSIIIGLPETDAGKLYNSAIVIDKQGQLAGHHRKVFLFGNQEKQLFTAGTRFQTFELCGHTCGLSICYDIEFPESTRTLAQQGAKLLFNPTANMTPYYQVPNSLARARALENGLTVVYANLCGQEGDLHYTGQSALIAPDGTDIARAGNDPCLLMADVSAYLQQDSGRRWSTQLQDLKEWQQHG